jgi:hypothetical protein
LKNFKGLKCSISVELVGDSFSKLRGELAGPPDTPYEGQQCTVLSCVKERKYRCNFVQLKRFNNKMFTIFGLSFVLYFLKILYGN